MRFTFTREQSEVLGKFLYDSTEVTVVVNTPRDKVLELAAELNVTSKRIMQWITNRKRGLKPELFIKAAFQACGIPGIRGEFLTPGISKPKKSRKRECPGAPKRPVRYKPRINRSDAVPKLLNFKETGFSNLRRENTEETSVDELYQPYDGEPPIKKIKREPQPSAASTTEKSDNPSSEGNGMIKQEGLGIGDITDFFQSFPGDELPISLVKAESQGGVQNSLYSPLNFDSFVKNNTPLSSGGYDEAGKRLPNAVLFPSFLRGLPSNTPNTPKTPLSSMQPKLEIKKPFGRPPPCVGGVDEPSTFGFVQPTSVKKEPSKIPNTKKRGNPLARVTAKKPRTKLTDNQQLILESFYTAKLFTTKEIKEAVAQSAGLPYNKVKIWIMNRKVRDKKGLPSLLPEIKPSKARGFTDVQRRQLMAFFNAGLLEEPTYRKAIAKATCLTEKQIRVWRMNARAKLKKEGKLERSEV